MSEKLWTDSQREAIEYSGKNLILSAAAGSGKTDTLTQRLIRIISDPEKNVPLSRILVVTFTNAAADELKERIGEALEKAIAENPSDRRAASSLAALDTASISTIHSFLKSEITPYISRFGLPPQFRIMDDAQVDILRRDTMRDTLNCFFELADSDFEYFWECISGAKSENGAEDVLISVRKSLLSQGLDAEKLREMAENEKNSSDFLLSARALPVKRLIREAGEYYSFMFSSFADELSAFPEGKAFAEASRLEELSKRFSAIAENDYETAKTFLSDAISSFFSLYVTKDERAFPCFGDFKDARSGFKDLLQKIETSYFSLNSSEYREISEKYSGVMKTLSRVLCRFEEDFSAQKKLKGAVDYDDLEMMAYRLFCHPDGSPTEEALEAGRKYDCILIDEYQDTGIVQDKIFSALSCECGLFMVGDIKQSIYGFRGARPELFRKYREKYSSGDGGNAIFLSENFRSDTNIIDFANILSEHIFKTGAAPFEEEDRLICKKPGGFDNISPCEIAVIRQPDKEEGLPFTDPEPEYIAERILRMLNGEEETGVENLSPSDIAVLVRSGRKAEDIANALASRNIPVNNGGAEHFFSYGEVLLSLCLINAADNPMRDIYLAGALKSHVFGFSMEDLIRIRGGDRDPLWYSLKRFAERDTSSELKEKARFAVSRIESWRKMASECNSLEILRIIFSDTGMLRYGGDGTRSSADVTKSVKSMLSTAAAVAFAGGNLHDLCLHFDALTKKQDKAPFVKIPGRVSILTVHKAKGLGFPVCFLCDNSKQFKKTDAGDSVLITSTGNIAMKLFDRSGLVKCKSTQYSAAALSIIRDSVEEEARILYVALTRAKSKLVLTVTSSDPDKMLEKERDKASFPAFPYTVARAASFKDWIIESAVRNEENGSFTLFTVEPSSIGHGTFKGKSADDSEGLQKAAEYFPPADSGVYKKAYLAGIPAKLTVSALKPDILGISDDESVTLDTDTVLYMPEKSPMPSFMQDSAPANDRGTATHIFMQFCDFGLLEKYGPAAELERLKEQKFISEENAHLVNLEEIELFLKSNIFNRMKNATEMYREKRFNARLGAWDFTTDPELRKKLQNDGVTLTVQGVVDCIFRDSEGKLILLDYKTDRLTKDELSDKELAAKKLLSRHKRQLLIYRDVTSRMLGKFDEVYIYSLPLGDTIEVK